MRVRSATLIQISGTRTPSRSRHAISTARRPTESADAQRAEDERRRAPAKTGLRLEDWVEILRRECLAQLLERARLELPDALAREAERLADLLERVLFL